MNTHFANTTLNQIAQILLRPLICQASTNQCTLGANPMCEFFHGWRRKAWVVTLGLALVVAVMWPWNPTGANGVPDAAGIFIVLAMTILSIRAMIGQLKQG